MLSYQQHLMQRYYGQQLNRCLGYFREQMKRLVEEEDPSDPLSDDRLAGLLRNRGGVSLARRTITKYRKVLAIPSSRKRRVF